jgi:hypothetical protein
VILAASALLGLCLACRVPDEPEPTDAFFGTPPPRNVSDYTPPGGGPGTPDGAPAAGGRGGGAGGAGGAADAGASGGAGGGTPAQGVGGVAMCELVKQTCPAQAQGCYPMPDGTARCWVSELKLPEASPCAQPHECQRGFTCFEKLCMQLCDTRTPTCLSRAVCKALPGFAPFGICQL